jgi:hypothetical protein
MFDVALSQRRHRCHGCDALWSRDGACGMWFLLHRGMSTHGHACMHAPVALFCSRSIRISVGYARRARLFCSRSIRISVGIQNPHAGR